MHVNKRTQDKRIPSNSRQLAPRQTLLTQTNICRLCIQPSHPRQVCPAFNATCSRCSRKGHLSSVPFKTMGELTTPSCNQDINTFDDEPYSNTVYVDANTIYMDTVGNGNTN